VGVITMHLDWTQRIKDDGLKVTIITYGSRKAEGSPLRELSDEALAAIQQDINTMGELFVNTVARNRGISAKVIKSTQAACFMAADGVEIGLADEVCPPDAAFKTYLKKQEPEMAKKKTFSFAHLHVARRHPKRRRKGQKAKARRAEEDEREMMPRTMSATTMRKKTNATMTLKMTATIRKLPKMTILTMMATMIAKKAKR
jgi:ClpP class serine protease